MKKSVNVDYLGMCEHCGRVFNLKDIPSNANGQAIFCRKCKKPFSMRSTGLGVFIETNKYVKTRWVGPNGNWVDERPKRGFEIGEFYAEV